MVWVSAPGDYATFNSNHTPDGTGANARRLYKVQAPATIIRDRVTEVERPDWWPTDEEVRAALRPEVAVRQL
jgi:hypothetical protein